MAEFLHRKNGTGVWYYRRRYPQDVAVAIGKSVFMQSLQTAVKRDAQQLARAVSVKFDEVCRQARLANEIVETCSRSAETAPIGQDSADSILSKVPSLIRRGALMVVEEQQRNPGDWPDAIRRLKGFYEAMKLGRVPVDAYLPPAHAQAILNGIESVIEGRPLPYLLVTEEPSRSASAETVGGWVEEPWPVLCGRALELYKDKVGLQRYKLAKSKLVDVRVQSTSGNDVQAGLLSWAKQRLGEVAPRTVKGQLDCLTSALRCVLPELKTPELKELKGVMQPRTGDRQSIPVQALRQALDIFQSQPLGRKVRKGYNGGASQFDDIAIETIAVLGIRPRELTQATSNAICEKEDVFGVTGLYFRIVNAKNKASERDIPLSDGTTEVLNITRLRAMLEWQEANPRSLHGAVSSLNERFRKKAQGYTLYQMRHSWKDIAVAVNVDYELRERILGHAVKGVAPVYGSGIPLRNGLDALTAVRSKIYGAE